MEDVNVVKMLCNILAHKLYYFGQYFSVNCFTVGSDTSSISSHSSTSRGAAAGGGLSVTDTVGRSASRAFWKSFISGIQRVVLFTPFLETVERIKTVGSYSRPQLEVGLALNAVGLSLVDNSKKRELAYIAITQYVCTCFSTTQSFCTTMPLVHYIYLPSISLPHTHTCAHTCSHAHTRPRTYTHRSGVIWQVEKARRKWKTLNHAMIALLEDAYLKKEIDVKCRNVSVSTKS